MVDAGNGDVSDYKTLHHTGSNPVLTTLQRFNNSLTQGRYQLVEFSYI